MSSPHLDNERRELLPWERGLLPEVCCSVLDIRFLFAWCAHHVRKAGVSRYGNNARAVFSLRGST